MAPTRTFLVSLALACAVEDCQQDQKRNAEGSALFQSTVKMEVSDTGVSDEAEQTEVEKPKWPSLFELLFEPGSSFDEHLADKARRRATIGALESRVQNLTKESPVVRQFVQSALAFVQTSVIDRIREEHKIQQGAINRAYQQFSTVDDLLKNDNREMSMMQSQVNKFAELHKECRGRQSTIAAKHHRRCFNSQLQLKRTVSANGATSMLSNGQESSACLNLQQELKDVKKECDDYQHSLESKGCSSYNWGINAAEEYQTRVSLVTSSYEAWLKNAKAEEEDRKKEFASLQKVSCNLRNLGKQFKEDNKKHCEVDTSEFTMKIQPTPKMLQLNPTPAKPCTAEFRAVHGYDKMPSDASLLECTTPCYAR